MSRWTNDLKSYAKILKEKKYRFIYFFKFLISLIEPFFSDSIHDDDPFMFCILFSFMLIRVIKRIFVYNCSLQRIGTVLLCCENL